jgi:uncharacterized membrane protein
MDPPPTPSGRRSILRRIGGVSPGYWLALAIAVYFAVSVTLSWFRALDLATTTWDQGIYQQALWSTAHGRPFWESADLETGGYGSLLQVHSVFVLYLLVPLYAAAPSEVTLFVVQSAVVALAAVPLFLLGRDLTGSGRWGLLAAGVYLVWAPLLAANLYDFHAEAFLPIELFAFVLLWTRARYAAGFAVAFLAFATIELAPILLFFAGVFFLLPARLEGRARWGRFRAALRAGRTGEYLRTGARRLIAQRRVVASLALLAACVAAYAFLLLVREQYLATWLGVPPFPSSLSGYVIGATPGQLGLAWGNLGGGLEVKVTFWLLLFALLGFVPFLAPRALVLSIPWVVFSFFSGDLNYVTLGFQYGFIEAASLLVAFTYGLVPIRAWIVRRPVLDVAPGVPDRPTLRILGAVRRPRRSTAIAWFGVGLVVLVAANLVASPVNPYLNRAGLGSGYQLAAPDMAGYLEAEEVVALITPAASVLASDNVFPLVANDVHAYSLSWTPAQVLRLPFSASNLPTFVLIAQSRTYAVPGWVNATISNASDYGVRGVAWSTPAGSVVLFERNYTGLAAVFGIRPPSGGAYYGPELAAAAR